MLIGYARVSTQQQDTALQREAFKRAGVRRVVEEKRSGVAERPALEKLLEGLKPGDVVVVYKLDRLARSLIDLMRILDRIASAGASFKSLTEPFETESVYGRFVVQILGSVAELERGMIRERCEAGRRAARERGVEFGRPRMLEEADVRPLVEAGLAQYQAAEVAGVSRSTMRHAAKKYGLSWVADGRTHRGPKHSKI